ncbi:MAG TPA: response regulator transcription factor [Solirubrobacteraceae bacterium]|jgi:two-component system response regulator DevR|nr:response regulator transcription factor [Solirubrobacteraceae bacterium]
MAFSAAGLPAPSVYPLPARRRGPLHPVSSAIPLRSLTVLVVDDHPVILRGLTNLLGDEPGIEVLANVDDHTQALAAARRLHPEIAVIDFHMAGENGLELACRLGSLPIAPRVVVYSAFPGVALVAGAMVAGAYAVIAKSALPHELIDAIHAARNGRRTLPAIARPELTALIAGLEPPDQSLLGMFAHGIPAEQIARILGLSEPELLERRRRIVRALSKPSNATLGSLTNGALHYSHGRH